MMKKSVMALLIIVVLVIALLPGIAQATTTNKVIKGDLNLMNISASQGDLEVDGYHWDEDTYTLKMKNLTIEGKLLIPDSKEKQGIYVEGNCVINRLEISKPSVNQYSNAITLSFCGSGVLVLEKQLQASQAHTIIVDEGTTLEVREGINVCTSGGRDSKITINGNMKVQNTSDSCILCGVLKIGSAGRLEVSGERGVKVCGCINEQGFKNSFQILEGGSFKANCKDYNVMVFLGGNSVNQEGAKTMLVIPENYIPYTHEMRVVSGENGETQYAITIVKKGMVPSLDYEILQNAGSTLEIKKQEISQETTTEEAATTTEEAATTTEEAATTEITSETTTELKTEETTEKITEAISEDTAEKETEEEILPEEENEDEENPDSDQADVEAPETGDNNFLALWFTVLGMSILSMISCALWNRKIEK